MHALLTGETHTSADCSLMSMHAHNTQEGGGRHEYELGALNQSQPELITAAGSLQQQPGPHAIPGGGTETKSPHIGELLGTRHT